MEIRKGNIWSDKLTGGKYKIIKIERHNGVILNITMQGVNNKSLTFDLGEWELKEFYTLQS